MALTDAKIRNTKPGTKPIKLTDGGGLYLLVKPTGKKLWRYRYRIEGRESTYAIGIYPDTGLAAARSERDGARKLVKKGINPAQQRKTERMRRSVEHANTFKAVAKEWIEKRRDGWSDYYHSQVKRALERMGYGSRFSAHGFRATASTILNELVYRSDVIEWQLVHKERNKVRASYNQAEYLKDRAQMMQAWADLIDTLREGEGKVVQGNFGKAV